MWLWLVYDAVIELFCCVVRAPGTSASHNPTVSRMQMMGQLYIYKYVPVVHTA